MSHVCFVTPPVTKPSEPNLSGPAAARALRAHGVSTSALDASIGWYARTLRAEVLEPLIPLASGGRTNVATAFARHVRSVTAPVPPLRRPETYRSRKVYSSAITHLDGALELASSPFPGFRVRIADVSVTGHRAESRASIAELAERPGPFDDYFVRELFPELRARATTHVALSLTFQNQVPGAVRLGRLLKDHLPEVTRLLGGPLVACWAATGLPLLGGAFDLFHQVLPGDEADLSRLAVELGGSVEPAFDGGPLSLDLEAMPWDAYLSPVPVVPAALGRGCYWRRCTFCPDHLHPGRTPCSLDGLSRWLGEVVERFPGGAMLHLTDSALPPRHLAHLARVISEGRLPIRWHGFVRPERIFTDEAFVRRLAEGGCDLLQLGLESGSSRLLRLMGKGADVELLHRIVRTTHAAGILNQAYLLFGLPTETDEDREATLRFVEEEAEALADVNLALLNLPRGSPMHQRPGDYGITEVIPFHAQTDLSLYDDFRCGASHPRVEARRWLDHRFLKSPRVREVVGDLRGPFKANHACFLPRR